MLEDPSSQPACRLLTSADGGVRWQQIYSVGGQFLNAVAVVPGNVSTVFVAGYVWNGATSNSTTLLLKTTGMASQPLRAKCHTAGVMLLTLICTSHDTLMTQLFKKLSQMGARHGPRAAAQACAAAAPL